MAKKMAVKTNSSKQKKFDFEMPRASRAVLRTGLVVIFVGVLGFVGFKGFSLWQEVWPVKKVVIQNETTYLTEKEIAMFVNAQSVKGMLSLDIEEMQKEALKLDWIKTVEIRKVWPDQLVFSINEHVPVAIVDGSILTQQGTKIESSIEHEQFASLPKIEMAVSNNVSNQQYMKVWREFKQIKRQLELLSLNLEGLRIDTVNNWHLNFKSGLEMNLGRKQRPERISRLVKVYSTINDRKNIRSIDLRYHNGVSVEWQKSEQAKS